MINTKEILEDLRKDHISKFLRLYIVCECCVRNVEEQEKNVKNALMLSSKFKKYVGQILTNDIISTIVNDKVASEFKVFKDKDSINLKEVKKNFKDSNVCDKLTLMFSSSEIELPQTETNKTSDRKKRKSMRMLRNEIMHKPSNKSTIEEVEQHFEEFESIMSEFVAEYNKKLNKPQHKNTQNTKPHKEVKTHSSN